MRFIFLQMTEKNYTDLDLLLSTPKKIVIIPHRNPDGDAMGSCLGLYHFLKKLNHEVQVISPNEYPDFLSWMPDANTTIAYETNKGIATEILTKADLIFTLDFNALYRVGEMENVLVTLNVPFIMIDHHEKPHDYAQFMYSDILISSTCEMVYNFITKLHKEHLIDTRIATCLYTGMVTDTGSFKYASTTATTHRIAANLIDKGIAASEVHHQLFDNNSTSRLQVLGRGLQNLRLLPEYKTSYISLSQDELNACNYKKGDTEGVVNYGLSIKGIIFTAFFSENREEEIIKISFRSIGDFDVNQFARDHFEGGGHKNAAGGKSTLSLTETIEKFTKIVSEKKFANVS